MKRANPIRHFVLGPAIALVAASGITHAAESIDFSSTSVSYRELDLSRDADVQRLYSRLRLASAKVCRPVPNDNPQFDAYQSCAGAALDRAVELVKSPELKTLHAKKSLRRWG